MIGFPSTDSVWVNRESDEKSCFVGMVQVYTDKFATTLKANATVVYPVRVTLLSYTSEFCCYLAEHGHTFAKLQPVSAAAQLYCVEEGADGSEDVDELAPLLCQLLTSNDKARRDVILHVLHKVIEIMLLFLKPAW